MKTLKNISRVLTLLFGVTALVLFFFPFGKVVTPMEEIVRTGTEFAFGASYETLEVGKSSDILFCFILTAFTVLFAALSFKFRKTRWATLGFSFVDAIYMFVIAFSHSNKFLDVQGLVSTENMYDGTTAYVNHAPLFIAIALTLTLIAAVVYILSADRVAVAGTGKPTIPKRLVKFLRDYKGEIVKIVWPGPRSVVKNTLIVLVMCLIVGVFIWAVDSGLKALIGLIPGL